MGFANMKMRTKLVTNTVILVAFMAAIILIYQYVLSETWTSYNGVINEEIAMEIQAETIENLMLQARRSERIF